VQNKKRRCVEKTIANAHAAHCSRNDS